MKRVVLLWKENAALALALAAFTAILSYNGWLWRFDDLVYDLYLRAWQRQPADSIVIVAIDERSLAELGQWPWPRRLHAELLEHLAAASVVVFDIIFAEPDARDRAGDEQLAEAMRRYGNVILPVSYSQQGPGGQVVEIMPLPDLATAAAALGHVDLEPDQDGITRRAFLKAGVGTPRWSSLALAALEHAGAAVAADLPGRRADRTESALPFVWVRDNQIMVPFVGPPGVFHRVSYVDVLRREVPAATFKGKFVFVGAVAPGMGGSFATPLASSRQLMPGVEFSANVLDVLQRQLSIREAGSVLVVLVSTLLAAFPLLIYPLLPGRWVLPAAAVLVLAIVAINFGALRFGHLWLPPAAALLAVLLSYPTWSWRQARHAIAYQRWLSEAQQRAVVTLHSVGEGVIVTDAQGAVLDLNVTAQRLTGFGSEEARGRLLTEVFKPVEERGRQQIPVPEPRMLEADTMTRLPDPCILVSRSGAEFVIRASAAPVRSDHDIFGMVLAIADITESQRLARRMAHQATHDALTRLPNRSLLEDRMQHALMHARRARQHVAVLFIDLDAFKTVNDGLGHSSGDQLLRAVAARLQGVLRDDDTVARVGGDEFVAVLEDLADPAAAQTVAEKILSTVRRPHEIEGEEIISTCSIGIALFPRDGEDFATLLKHADGAMYRAKQGGGAKAEFFTSDMDSHALDKLIMARAIRRARRDDELELYYQPQVELQSGRIVGVEALLRWHHPERGVLEPASFLAVAEMAGSDVSLDEWVLSAACRQVQRWKDLGLPDFRVAVNLSPRQFLRDDFPKLIGDILSSFDLAVQTFEIEITERTIMQDIDRAMHRLHQLREIGISLAIDDFGIGHSSLNYLARFPVERLKIDRSFIQALPDDRQYAAIVSALIAMAHSLGLVVLAEGVETSAQEEFLRSQGCHEAQGFLFGRPIPGTSVDLLRRSPPAPRSSHALRGGGKPPL